MSVVVPDFVRVARLESEIAVPPDARRQHSFRIWGERSGRVQWSPPTDLCLAESGWSPPRKGRSQWRGVPDGQHPAVYMVVFLGACPSCAGRDAACKRCAGKAEVPVTGPVLVDPSHTPGAVVPMSIVEFERAEWRYSSASFHRRHPRKPWPKDGQGPVRLTAHALGLARDLLVEWRQLTDALAGNQIAAGLVDLEYGQDLGRLVELLARLEAKVSQVQKTGPVRAHMRKIAAGRLSS